MPAPIPAAMFSSRFNHGKRSFFFDVRKSKKDKPYLKIAVSSIEGEDKKRTFINIFDNEAIEFCQAVSEATGYIVKPA
jgi:hypothetical protein